MICIPLMASTMDEALALLRESLPGADCIEFRIDCLREEADVRALLHACTVPAIVTCRAKREGGAFAGGEDERLALLQDAVDAGAAYVDVEADTVERIRRRGATKLIASWHDFDRTPPDLTARVRAMAALPCDVVKFATMATDLADNLRCFEALRQCPKPAIGLCMGELGEASRVLNLRYGALLTFGALAAGKESAPGQLAAGELRDLYRIDRIGETTTLYAVAGDPIAHSMSPAIHNTAFAALGLDAAYLKFRVADFDRFLRDIVEPLGLSGLSVTIPHKQAALRAGTEIDPLAQRIGAANTLSRIEGGWLAENTDCAAATEAIAREAERTGLTLHGAEALLIGAGGAARALAVGLLDRGCKLTVANRTVAKARALAEELGGTAIALEEIPAKRYAVVANSTAVGMHPHVDASPAPAEIFAPGMVVFDAVYNPRETRLLRAAKERGAAVVDGVAMFVGQAAAQFARWTGRDAPREIMERIVVEKLSRG